MASETDRKTKTGLLRATVKLEQVDGTLNEIDSDDDKYSLSLRRARGLAKALLASLYELIEAGIAIGRGAVPSQMSIDELLRAVRTETGDSSKELQQEVERVTRQAEELSDEDEHDSEDESSKPKTYPEPDSSEALGEAHVAAQINAAGREVALITVKNWSTAERRAALSWANTTLAGASPSREPVIDQRYLEDLHLGSSSDVETLLSWVDIPMPADGEVEQADLDRLIDWAIATHRAARGESDIKIPPCPDAFLPSDELFEAIHDYLEDQASEPMTVDQLIKHFHADDFGASFAVRALLKAGEIYESDRSGGTVTLSEENQGQAWHASSLASAAKCIANGLPWPSGGDGDGRDDSEENDAIAEDDPPDGVESPDEAEPDTTGAMELVS